MPRYTITPSATSDAVILRRDDLYLLLLVNLTSDEQTAILRGLNGPSEATAKRVAELRAIACDYRQLAGIAMGLNQNYCELTARELESQANYLESR